MYIKTTRGWQPIPCLAVNHNDLQGVFRPKTAEVAAAENDARAEAFRKDVNKYINGDISKDEVFRAYKQPIYGAFGEKL